LEGEGLRGKHAGGLAYEVFNKEKKAAPAAPATAAQ
jgi:hypothetical protein